MFVLDTNILSALMSLPPAPEVIGWLDRQRDELLFTTSISQAEILAGLAVMPEGRRRHTLEDAATAIFLEDFDGRVLPFDFEAAAAYAQMFAARRRIGRSAATFDLMIGAIAKSHGASIVTRDTTGFEGYDLTLINPWDAA
jgi:toxin FitB